MATFTTTATSDTDLELKVERLRDELAELRRAFKLWQNKVLRAFAVGFVLLTFIGGSVWWFGYRHHRDIQQISAEARHITKEKIRAQLLESVERTRQAALADAQKAKGWEERERLRQAAEKAYAGSVSRIDELAASFAEIEGTARSSQVFDEMTRILAEEGVDQALAYAATQQPGILEKVKARAAAAREKNRADLLPLLKSAQLQAERNQPAEAERLFADILALEPDWPDARNAFAWFLIQRGEVIEPAKGNFEAPRSRSNLPRDSCPRSTGEIAADWAPTQNNLGLALQDLGTRSGGEEGRKLLEEAVAASRALWRSMREPICLRIGPRPRTIWASRFGIWERAAAEKKAASCSRGGGRLPKRSGGLYQSRSAAGLGHDPEQSGHRAWDLGTRSGGEEGRKLLEEAVAAYRSALEVRTKADLPQDWARTQNNLGSALLGSGNAQRRRRRPQTPSRSRRRLPKRSGGLYQSRSASGLGRTQNNLGIALWDLGTRSGGEEGRKLLREAVAAYRSALEVRTKADLPQDWAGTQNNLGNALGNWERAAAEKKAASCSRSGGRLSIRPRGLYQSRSASGLGPDPEQSGHRACRTQEAQWRRRRPQSAPEAVAAFRSALEV